MATFRQVYHCTTGLARHGRRLPAAERLAWQTLTLQLESLAEQPWASIPPWQVPTGYAEDVRALRDELASAAAPPAPLVVRWLDAWLAEHAQRASRRVLVAPWEDRAQPQAPLAHVQRRGRRRRAAPGARSGWAVLRVSGANVDTEADSWRAAVLNNAAELSCAADGRPWHWEDNGYGWQVYIGPPPTPGDPPARQLVAELERTAAGLNPGWWILVAGARIP